MRYGASTFIWVSPFSNKTLDLLDKAKVFGFDILEICVEDPDTLDPASIRAHADKAGVALTICGAFGPSRDLSSEDAAVRQNGLAYLKRCVKKGLLKIGQAPARRYAYYLTPHGFAEKSRLTVEYLSSSFSFFRRAREDCSSALEAAHARGWNRIALIGVSDLAEITTICALEQGITIVAVVDAKARRDRFVGIQVVASLDAVPGGFDALVITDLATTRDTVQAALTDSDTERLRYDLMERVSRFRAQGIIVDVTAIDVMDSFAARSLRTIAHMTRLRGAVTVIVGLQPEVAFAMVQLGLAFDDMNTALDLEEGLALLNRQLGLGKSTIGRDGGG